MVDQHNQQVLSFFGCTESQVLAMYASWHDVVVNAESGGGVTKHSQTKTSHEGSDFEDIQTSFEPGDKYKREGYENLEERRSHRDGKDPFLEADADGDRLDRPIEVQRLIAYLNQYRQQRARRKDDESGCNE